MNQYYRVKKLYHFIALMVTMALYTLLLSLVSKQIGTLAPLVTLPFGFCTALFIDGLFRNQ